MAHPHRKRIMGFTIVELIIATAVSLVLAGVVIQVLVLTMRTTDQTSVQADTQGRARAALKQLELQLRDGGAVLTRYTPPGVYPTTIYTTRATSTERTIVAAVPSIDANGVPCAFRGINLVYDCIVWRAIQDASGLWDLSRLIFVNAFQMPVSYFSYGGVSYTVPTTFGRASETTPVSLFDDAYEYEIELWGDTGKIIPVGSLTTAPATSALMDMPLILDDSGNRTTTPITITKTTVVKVIKLTFRAAAGKLQGGGQVNQSNTLAVSVRLRNRQAW